MPARKGQKFKHYSEEFKTRAIQMKLAGLSHREIMDQLDIHDCRTTEDMDAEVQDTGGVRSTGSTRTS